MKTYSDNMQDASLEANRSQANNQNDFFTGNKGPMMAGGLSLVGATMIFAGFFILPWFFCRLSDIVDGRVTGFHMLLQLIAGMLVSLAGGLSEDSRNASLVVFVLFFLATAFVADIPYSGYRVARIGLKLVQTLDMPADQQKRLAKRLKRAAIAGLVPTFLYLSLAVVGIPSTGKGGLFANEIVVELTGKGLWVTLIGFGVALAASTLISTVGAWKEQSQSMRRADDNRLQRPPGTSGQ